MKEQGWLRMEKITKGELEKFWLNFSRCASRDVARFRAFGHSLMVIRARFSFECRKVIGFALLTPHDSRLYLFFIQSEVQ